MSLVLLVLVSGPGLGQDVLVGETQTVQVQPDRAQGMRSETLAKIVRQLLRRKVIDLVIEEFAGLPNGTRIGVGGLRLRPLRIRC